MIARDRRFYADNPCPACGHYGTGMAPSWCFAWEGDRKFWCGRASTYKGMRGEPKEDGWVFWFKTLEEAKASGDLPPSNAGRAPRVDKKRERQEVDRALFARVEEMARDRITRGQTSELADALGVSMTALRRLRIGWLDAGTGLKVNRKTGEEYRTRILLPQELNTTCRGAGAYTFPIYDGRWNICGIRLRGWPPTPEHRAGFKYAVDGIDGSGLHLPKGLSEARGGDLLLPEGASGTAALLSLRLHAIGRPNCRAGVEYMIDAIRRIDPARVFVIGDRDEPDSMGRRAGQESAPVVAARIRDGCPRLGVCTYLIPPEEMKDSRDWLGDGATREEILGAMDESAELVTGRGWRNAG